MQLRRRLHVWRAKRAPKDERGFTLLEISVACMLLGLSSIVILGGLFTVVRSSKINSDQSRVEAVLSNAADRLGSWTYTPCPPVSGAGSYLDVVQAAASTVGWQPASVSIVSLTYWDPTTSTWSNSNTASGTGCNASVSATSPRTLQKIVIRVQTPTGGYSRQLEVVKNNVVPI